MCYHQEHTYKQADNKIPFHNILFINTTTANPVPYIQPTEVCEELMLIIFFHFSKKDCHPVLGKIVSISTGRRDLSLKDYHYIALVNAELRRKIIASLFFCI